MFFECPRGSVSPERQEVPDGAGEDPDHEQNYRYSLSLHRTEQEHLRRITVGSRRQVGVATRVSAIYAADEWGVEVLPSRPDAGNDQEDTTELGKGGYGEQDPSSDVHPLRMPQRAAGRRACQSALELPKADATPIVSPAAYAGSSGREFAGTSAS